MPQGWQRLAAGPKIALLAVAVASGSALAHVPQARAADPLDAFDDPKLARELPATPPAATRAPGPPLALPAKPVTPPAVSRPPAPKAVVAASAKPAGPPAPVASPSPSPKAVTAAPAKPVAPPATIPSPAPKAAVAAAPAKPIVTPADRAVVGGQPAVAPPVGPAKAASPPPLPGPPAPAVVLSPAPFVTPPSPAPGATSPAPIAAAAPAPVAAAAPAPVAAPAPAAAPAPVAAPPSAAVAAPAPIKPAAPLAAAAAASVPQATTRAPEPAAAATATADLTAKARPPEPAAPAASGPWPYHPRLKLAYRWFSFSRMPASGSTGAAASETFQSLSLDAYPTSTYLRVGFSSQFGWESGGFQRTGDYFLAESVSTGFQLPGRFTPFLEGLAGAGYMRRMQAGSSSPTAYWQLGVDAGVEVYFASRAYVSVALGFLRPGNLFVQQKNLSGIDADTWSLKFGVGI